MLVGVGLQADAVYDYDYGGGTHWTQGKSSYWGGPGGDLVSAFGSS